jgi:hypothetical protein
LVDARPRFDLVALKPCGKPTHHEGEAVTAIIREGLKERKCLGSDNREFQKLTNYSMMEVQRGDAVCDVCIFSENATGFKRHERVTIAGRDEEGTLVARRESGSLAPLPLHQASRFQV